MNVQALLSVVLCLLTCKECHASVYCEDQNEVIQYSCEDTAYCCGAMECCLLENGVDFFSLWYFWASCGMAILIIGVVGGMLCKQGKRHHDMETRVHDVSLNNNGWEQPQPEPRAHPHPQNAQIVVIPMMCNQASSSRQGPFQISGHAVPLGTLPIGPHPGMHQPRGGHGSNQGRPLPIPRRADPLPGGLTKPLGPAYEQPSMFGPLPPGYIPNT